MKKLVLICLVIGVTISCKKIFPTKNKNKVSIVNTANYQCAAKIRLDGGTEQSIDRGGAYTFENVTDGNHTITLSAGNPCVNYSSGTSCNFDLSKSITKTISVINTSGAQLTLTCN